MKRRPSVVAASSLLVTVVVLSAIVPTASLGRGSRPAISATSNIHSTPPPAEEFV
jgi:hypothetical protein